MARLLTAIFPISMVALLAACASTGVAEHPGQTLKDTHSIGDLIAKPDTRPIHIMFVHGMRASGPATSSTFQAAMCNGLEDCQELPSPARKFLDVGKHAPPAQVVNRRVWRTPEEWAASRPFVDRRIYRISGKEVIVDELNWWPLLFPLKCRFLVMPEIYLSGADAEHLTLCAKTDPPYYPWLAQSDIDAALAQRSSKSGGAPINRMLKQQIMTWGLADAVIAVGPMRMYLNRTIEAAFQYASDASFGEENQEFVVVSESLGSFVVMDALSENNDTAPTARRILENDTYDLYFFANQFAILSLARLWESKIASRSADATHASEAAPATAKPSISPLEIWANSGDERHKH